jgi:hypothetical protein
MADRVERNSLVIASRAFSAPSADQLRDWGAVASLAIARAKASNIGSLEAPDAYFAAVLDRDRAGRSQAHPRTDAAVGRHAAAHGANARLVVRG